MKRLGNVFEEIVDFGNLQKAAYKARKGKSEQLKIQDFFYHLEYHLITLQNQLLEQKYQPQNYYTFTIREPKKRIISAPHFIDCVLQHAIFNILEPWCERFYIYDSYACRKEKGQHRALLKAQFFAKKYNYYCKFDVANFFATIDRQILQNILRRKIKDQKLLWLLDVIIENSPGKIGLPIGNLTSQHFANIYMNELDYFIKQKLAIKGYLRFMDDGVIYGQSKQETWHYKSEIINFLRQTLHLELNEKATFLRPIHQGIPFLGFYIFPNLIRIQRKNWVRFRRKFKKRQQQYLNAEITIETLTNSISSLITHICQANTWTLRGLFLEDHEIDF